MTKSAPNKRSLVITLLDLKNAFGEVHQNLTQEVLSCHHTPAKAKTLISSLYTAFHTSVITDCFSYSTLSPVDEVFLKVTALASYYSTCVVMPSFSAFFRKNISNLASLLMIHSVVFLCQFTGSSLRKMQLL